MSERIRLVVDGKPAEIDADPAMPLLYALRDDLGMANPKFGCGLAQCGACTVHVDGQPTRSCVTPVSAVQGKKVTTIAGLGTPGRPHPLQQAFVAEQVPQCGYCLSGWMMTAAALLRDKPKPSDRQVPNPLGGPQCRCGPPSALLPPIERGAGGTSAS